MTDLNQKIYTEWLRTGKTITELSRQFKCSVAAASRSIDKGIAFDKIKKQIKLN